MNKHVGLIFLLSIFFSIGQAQGKNKDIVVEALDEVNFLEEQYAENQKTLTRKWLGSVSEIEQSPKSIEEALELILYSAIEGKKDTLNKFFIGNSYSTKKLVESFYDEGLLDEESPKLVLNRKVTVNLFYVTGVNLPTTVIEYTLFSKKTQFTKSVAITKLNSDTEKQEHGFQIEPFNSQMLFNQFLFAEREKCISYKHSSNVQLDSSSFKKCSKEESKLRISHRFVNNLPILSSL